MRTLSLAVAAGLLAVGACALRSDARPGADRYTFEIRPVGAVDCPAPAGLFAPLADAPGGFAPAAPPPTDCPAENQMLTLLRDGEPVDSVLGFRLWLGFEDGGPATRDLDGDGTDELVVSTWTGGAHCCVSHLAVSLGEAPRLLGVLDVGHTDEPEVGDPDSDGRTEVVFFDPTFAYWNAAFAVSAAPRVVAEWTAGGPAASPDDMREPPLAPDAFDALVREVRAGRWPADGLPPPAYWTAILDLLYAGRAGQARAFAEAAWTGGPQARVVFLAWLGAQLDQSPHAEAVHALNPDLREWL